MRRPARFLLALALTAALLLGAAVVAQANARTGSTPKVHLNAGRHGRAHVHPRCRNVLRALARHRRHRHTLEECMKLSEMRMRARRERMLLRRADASGHGPRAGIRPPSSAGKARESGEAMIAAVLATPCTNTDITPEPANLQVAREAILCLVNQERATHNEQPLRTNPKLQAAAEAHSNECVELDYFAHVSPSGETPVERIQATGYIPSPFDGYVLGENLAWGTYELGTPQAIVAAWIASPPHLANILEARYTETGIGVTAAVPPSRGEGAPGATYAQEFGDIIV